MAEILELEFTNKSLARHNQPDHATIPIGA